ncbi:MAG: TA system antitoxin ParD family protein [Janthinobacterium lividum]
MSTIRISDNIFHETEIYGKVYNKSAPKQIEFWLRIGKLAEENLDLRYKDIMDILMALEEKKLNLVEEYQFSS